MFMSSCYVQVINDSQIRRGHSCWVPSFFCYFVITKQNLQKSHRLIVICDIYDISTSVLVVSVGIFHFCQKICFRIPLIKNIQRYCISLHQLLRLRSVKALVLKLLQWHKISLHLLFACISLHQLLRLRSVKALVLKLLQLIFYETAKLYEMFLSRLKIHKIFIEFSTLSKNRLKVWYIFVFFFLSFCLFYLVYLVDLEWWGWWVG